MKGKVWIIKIRSNIYFKDLLFVLIFVHCKADLESLKNFAHARNTLMPEIYYI